MTPEMFHHRSAHFALLPPPFALAKPFRKSLRNENINYRSGWFFVTMQVEHNKSICKMEQS